MNGWSWHMVMTIGERGKNRLEIEVFSDTITFNGYDGADDNFPIFFQELKGGDKINGFVKTLENHVHEHYLRDPDDPEKSEP